MGILNVTPDSFSDGGAHARGELALEHALLMVEQGAGIIDVGGESTRPGAAEVSVDEELERVLPVIESLAAASDVLISIDTSKLDVARAALDAGAHIVNDVTGLTGPQSGRPMAELCAETGAGLVVMHMQGVPRTMQRRPEYLHPDGVVGEVRGFFEERLETLQNYGMDSEAICFDPGIGFGKTVEHNLELLAALGCLQAELKRPLLLGVSRKSIIDRLCDVEDPRQRDGGTAALTALACQQGVFWHRVHDVVGNRQAVLLSRALRE